MTTTIENQREDHGYQAFLQAASAAEEIIRGHPDATETERADGYQYLAGMLNYHLERAFKAYDTDYPCFVRDMDPVRHWGFPTPYHHYFSAQISGEGVYRIFGSRGNTVDFCLEILSGLVGDDGEIGQRIDALESSRLQLEADGSYEIIVGGPPRPGNWLKSGTSARTIFVRQTANDWATERASPMLIERIDTPERPFTPPTRADIQQRYAIAARNLLSQVRLLDGFARNWATVLPLNELPAPAVGPADAGYFPGQFNSKCRFELAPGQALLIELPPCGARYQSLCLGHPRWFNSLYPRNRQSTLNGAQSHLSSDGLYRYVISATDPGVHNWLDTGGLQRGFLFMRLQRVEGHGAIREPKLQLLPLAALRDALPADEPRITPAARLASLRQRRLSLDRRFC